jgi:hypothetical protein
MSVASVLLSIERAKRPIQLSVVTGIIDKYGGFRVVVERSFAVGDHISAEREEEGFTIPYYWVHEPVHWERIPKVMADAANHTNACLIKAGRNMRVSAK